VFDERDFNALPGTNSFRLNSHGDEVYLYSADLSGNLTGYSDGFSFGAAQNGVSFGRFVNSVGEILYPAQNSNSLGFSNTGPRIGPVVINEIRYAPAAGFDEFVELKNLTASAVPLYDPVHPTNTWKVDGIGFRFPEGAEIAPNGLLLVTRLDAALFRTKYSVPDSVPIFGPYSGALQDSGETLDLQRPDTPDLVTNGVVVTILVPYLSVDTVRYSDRFPWPDNVAGTLLSLERINSGAFGNDPANWRISPAQASPGFENDGNRPPVVFAGLDQVFSVAGFPFSVALEATVMDDGLPNPPGLLKTSWSMVDGPGAVLFDDPSARSPLATFPGVGTYVFRFTADDGALKSSAEIAITLQLQPASASLVSTGSVWRYNDHGLDLGTAWREVAYNDSAWLSGPAELGYGDDAENRPEATVVGYGPDPNNKYITTYFRRSFMVTNATAFTDLTVNLMRDDGAAVYLNGTNIFISNLPDGPIDYLIRAPNGIGGSDEYAFYSTNVPPSLLKEGTNVLAVEVHQTSPTSSDISFDLELTGHRLPVNAPPSANAGAGQTIDLVQIAALNGAVSDDGLPIPPGLLTNSWNQISGPGAVSFENPNAARTKASFTQPGAYTLRLTAGDGAFIETSDVVVTVTNGIASWKAQYFSPAELAVPGISGDLADPDHDGQNNHQEYIAGTNPRDIQSVLRLEVVADSGAHRLRFVAAAGRTYTVLYRDSVISGSWLRLLDVPSSESEGIFEISEPDSAGERYYRLITPQQP
jgi:hypothetical protein